MKRHGRNGLWRESTKPVNLMCLYNVSYESMSKFVLLAVCAHHNLVKPSNSLKPSLFLYRTDAPARQFFKKKQHTRWYNKMNARLDKKWERLWQEDFAPLFSSDQDPPDVQHCVQPQAHPCQHIKVISSLDAFKFQTSYSMMI